MTTTPTMQSTEENKHNQQRTQNANKKTHKPKGKKDTFHTLELVDYGPSQDYSRPRATQLAIDNTRQYISMRPQQLQEIISKAASNQTHYGANLDDIADLYSSNNDQLRRELDAIKHAVLPRDVRSKDAGIDYADKLELKKKAYQAESELIKEKFGFIPSNENLEIIKTKFPKLSSFKGSNADFRAALILDDPPEELLHAINYCKKTGALFTEGHADPSNVWATRGSDYYANAGLAQAKSRFTYSLCDRFDLVDRATYKQSIVPEHNSAVVQTGITTFAAGCAQWSNIFTIEPNAAATSGIYGFIFSPSKQSIFSTYYWDPAASGGPAFLLGTQISNPFWTTGPNNNTYCVAASVTSSAIASPLYTSGIETLWSDVSAMENQADTINDLTAGNLNFNGHPMVTTGPILENHSLVLLPQNFTQMLSNFTSTAGVTLDRQSMIAVGYITGAIGTTAVASIRLSARFNVTNKPSGYTQNTVSFAEPGPATQPFIAELARRYPQIFLSDVKWRTSLLAKLEQVEPYYSDLLRAVAGHISNNPVIIDNNCQMSQQSDVSFIY